MSRTRTATKADPASADGTTCRNCGANLTGPHCSRCGQKDLPLDPPLRQMLAEWLEEHVALDSRVARTFGTLVRRPGRLTIEYNRGRRARYVPPLRLYMVVSVVFFFALALGPEVVHIQTDDDADAAAETSGTETSAAESSGVAREAEGSSEGGLAAWLSARAREAQSDPAAFNRFWIRVFAWSMFVFVPVAALLLKVAFRRPKRAYIRHLVFALHTHTFGFLIVALAMGTSMLLPVDREAAVRVLMPAAIVASLVYFYLALLRVYGEGVVRTALKSFLMGAAYVLAQVIFLAASLLVAFVLF